MSDERKLRDSDTEATASDAEATAADATDGTASRPSGKRSGRRPRGAASTTAKSASAASATGTVTSTRPARASSAKTAVANRQKSDNIFKRLRKFLREVIAELRKVIWPNRKQMVTYTSVVLVFVVFMVAFISGLDVAFIKGVSWLFG